MITQNQKNILWFVLGVILIPSVTMFGTISASPGAGKVHSSDMFSVEYNKEVGEEVEKGVLNLISEGRYKCCLESPCVYCFADKEHQDRELVCDCLEDIMNGKHPCGECIGEIMEGNGNSLIAEYFATSIAEEVGYQHLGTIQKIIVEKYGIPVNEQL